jgi:inward rectifier potassium channel
MAGIIPRIKDKQSELGFGRHISSQGRLINPDGKFNVLRHRNALSDNIYYRLVTMPSWLFFLLTLLVFGLINSIFATTYILSGDKQLSGMPHDSFLSSWLHAFFFSTQTLTTVGYGHISPDGRLASFIASFESFLGLLLFALISGLLYGRFSRPMAKLVFSDRALIAPFKSGQALMFRMVNPRTSELLETEAKVMLAISQTDETTGEAARRFFSLDLEISKIAFFPLSWTIVHPISEDSPIFGLSQEQLKEANAEVMVLVAGTDESTEQIVHARRSYIAEEIVWNARFSPMMSKTKDLTRTVIHTRKVSDHELN